MRETTSQGWCRAYAACGHFARRWAPVDVVVVSHLPRVRGDADKICLRQIDWRAEAVRVGALTAQVVGHEENVILVAHF